MAAVGAKKWVMLELARVVGAMWKSGAASAVAAKTISRSSRALFIKKSFVCAPLSPALRVLSGRFRLGRKALTTSYTD